MSTAIMPITVTHPAVPCSCCGTTEGSKRSGSEGDQYVRYRGERYGWAGMLCATCRAREIRHEKSRDPWAASRAKSGVGLLPVAVAGRNQRPGERPLALRRPRSLTGSGSRPSRSPRTSSRFVRKASETDADPAPAPRSRRLRQQRWAELAASDRRLVVESRRQAMSRT